VQAPQTFMSLNREHRLAAKNRHFFVLFFGVTEALLIIHPHEIELKGNKTTEVDEEEKKVTQEVFRKDGLIKLCREM
jgi:hypothetical protein